MRDCSVFVFIQIDDLWRGLETQPLAKGIVESLPSDLQRLLFSCPISYGADPRGASF
jgi:hypothetical protein